MGSTKFKSKKTQFLSRKLYYMITLVEENKDFINIRRRGGCHHLLFSLSLNSVFLDSKLCLWQEHFKTKVFHLKRYKNPAIHLYIFSSFHVELFCIKTLLPEGQTILGSVYRHALHPLPPLSTLHCTPCTPAPRATCPQTPIPSFSGVPFTLHCSPIPTELDSITTFHFKSYQSPTHFTTKYIAAMLCLQKY